ncbi:MAG: DUF3393 domain-containing protein [Pseudomonadales bacterium]|nr:DUF3393 domain-containing protein [Pseudomonadales bacterium]
MKKNDSHRRQRSAAILILAATVLWQPAAWPEEDPFDRLDNLLDDNFDTIDATLEERYRKIDAAMESAYQALGKKVEATWGKDDVELPSRKAWVDYSTDMQTRRIMDFETGTLTIEHVIDITEGADEIIAELAKAAREASTDTESDLAGKDQAMTMARETLAREGIELPPPSPERDTPVLANVADAPPPAEIRVAVDNAMKQGTTQKKITIKVPFRPGYANTLAERYIGDVSEQAEKEDLPPSLILAVMETESSFNPRATSGVPAYGLMQLVPSSGAMDAYEYLFGEKQLVDPEYLYQPSQNVELGAAYLSILDNRYLRAINDPESRELCAIAAYNTGAGNVARSFTGTTNVREAAGIINSMSPAEVYNHLRENLPYEETRNYVLKVTEAKKKYSAYDGGR